MLVSCVNFFYVSYLNVTQDVSSTLLCFIFAKICKAMAIFTLTFAVRKYNRCWRTDSGFSWDTCRCVCACDIPLYCVYYSSSLSSSHVEQLVHIVSCCLSLLFLRSRLVLWLSYACQHACEVARLLWNKKVASNIQYTEFAVIRVWIHITLLKSGGPQRTHTVISYVPRLMVMRCNMTRSNFSLFVTHRFTGFYLVAAACTRVKQQNELTQ